MAENTFDSALGQFIYDAEMDWYILNYNDGTRTFDIQVAQEDTDFDLFKRQLPHIEQLIKWGYYENILIAMENKMLALKNKEWLREGEKEMTLEEFRKNIIFENIMFYDDGTSELYCDANDMFNEYYIEAVADKNGQFVYAGFAGDYEE